MAEQKRDYYEVLGVGKNASEAEIKRAYRKMAKENHPDLHPGDKECEARFKEANEAYEVLSNPDKKAKYDQFGFAGVDPNYGGGAGYGGGFTGDFDFGDLGDIFGSFFGGGRSTRRSASAPMQGDDIGARVELTFEEAAFGAEKEVTASRVEDCDQCHGSGAAPGTSAETCPRCKGTGSVRTQQNFMGMTMQSTAACPDCRGTGRIIRTPCSRCKGKGKVRRSHKLMVKFPAGIDDGQTLRVRGEGNTGLNGGPNGDLMVTVSVRSHPLFTRQGQDVYCEMPITFTQAACGAEVEVPTLDGKVRYTIGEGTQTGTTFRLKGKGIPYVNGRSRGDQYVTVVVETPTRLTREQKDLLHKFEEATSESAQPKRKKFFEKLRDAFDK